MKIDFVLASNTEFAEILEMMSQFNANDNYSFNREKTGKNLSCFIDDPRLGRAWIINIDGLMAGYLVLAFGFSFENNGRDAFIDELYLKPEYRHKGIGKLAMEFLEREAFSLGVSVIHLEVGQHNQNGMRLYESQGYRNNNRILLSKNIVSGEQK